MHCSELHDVIGSRTSNVHNFSVNQTRVLFFNQGAHLVLMVHTCTASFSLLDRQGPLNFVGEDDNFLCTAKRV